MARLFDSGIFSVEDSDGSVGAGWKLNFYVTGTATRKNTYPTEADAVAGTNANANPVVADSNGRFGPIWLADGDYKLVMTDDADVTVVTRDPIDNNLEAELSAATGAAKVGTTLGAPGLTGYADPQNVQSALDSLQVPLLRFIPSAQHAGLFDGSYSYDCGPAINTAMEELSSRGGGTLFIPGGGKLGIGTKVIHRNGVAVVNESPAARSVLYMQNGANIRMWESLNYDAVKAGTSDVILYEGGLSGLFFVGNKANNATGSGMFMAESGFTYDNVWFDDFALEGFERRGTRVVDTNFPQTPYRRRVETLVKDMSLTRCGGASNYAFDLGGPDDLEAFGILLGGNPGKARLAVESQRLFGIHAYSNGEAVANDYGVEIDKGAYIFGLEVRDNYYGGVKITSNAPFTRIVGFQGQKNGRNTTADTERHVLIEGTDCYIDGRIQSADDSLNVATNGTQPGIEIATGADRPTVKLNISGNNSGSTRNMTKGAIIGDVDDYDIDLTVNHINGPAVQLNSSVDPQRRGKLVARVTNAVSALEKNTTVQGGEITLIDRGSNDSLYTGTVNVSTLEKWDVRSTTGSKSNAAVYSTDIAADAATSGTATIAHGLLTHASLTVQPDYARITADVVRPSTGTLPDDVIVDLKIKNRDATNVEVRWTVTTASGTAGSKFRIAVQARLGA